MSCDFIALATPGVQTLKPYAVGKPTEELERELGIKNIVKLASNENPLGPGKLALHAARQALESLHLYPDGAGFYLKSALREKFGLRPEQITLGNGSNDLLELIGRGFLNRGDEVIFSQHAFAVYMLVTLGCSAKPVEVPAKLFGHDLAAMADAITERTRIIFIANPNNPTGTWFHRQALESFMQRVPEEVLVVLDEAYVEYVEEEGYPNGFEFVDRYRNVIVTRTFSKMYGLAGLRVGYAVANPEITNVLNRVRQPFNVNAPALAAAAAALNDDNYIEDSKSENTSGLVQIAEGLQALNLHAIPSVANFIAFDCGRPAQPIYEALLHEGVIVRPIGGYGMPNHLRVSIGLGEQNDRFLRALEKVLNV
ncbi:histidinol-phosphate transaminase [Alcanivorax sp. 1008]|uniref:histidinol-phosphate transaminase n=1 Tax=Alcanivorax sp. 1008 TaxID=2816853 RepID=UPI001DD6AD02|nr:histidinol-phosphate transaminase [Alcanivorax sp. 1008]MCC1495724.1 histidinol-phosphate transaminase [Alcanivorax sp. 1008]